MLRGLTALEVVLAAAHSSGRAPWVLSRAAQLCVSSAGQEEPAEEAPVPTTMGREKCQTWDNRDGDRVRLCMCHRGGGGW